MFVLLTALDGIHTTTNQHLKKINISKLSENYLGAARWQQTRASLLYNVPVPITEDGERCRPR